MGIKGQNICKEFGDPAVKVLHEINLSIEDGDFVSISGRSGSGKSTLLYILSTLDTPSSGIVEIDGHNLANMNSKKLHSFRNKNIGFIFQFHYLLPELTALENVLLGPKNLGLEKEMKNHALKLLDDLEIADQAHKFPGHMSGGQQQRVAIARALVLSPKYIFADEPTGNLDSVSGQKVMDILSKINKENKTTIVLVTHDQDYAAIAKKEIFLVDGRVSSKE